MKSKLHDSVKEALSAATTYSYDKLLPDNYWAGEVKSNVTPTSEYVFLRHALGVELSNREKEAIRKYLLSEQCDDGSWTHGFGCPGNITCTVEAYLALKLLGVPMKSESLSRAQEFVKSRGGVAATSMFTRVVLAGLGLFPWKSIPILPMEIILLPNWMPFTIYNIASWSRLMIVAFLICRHHQSVRPFPNGSSVKSTFLDELWLNPEDKAVAYCLSFWQACRSNFVSFTLTLIHTVLFCANQFLHPLRKIARRRCVTWLLEAQELDGDWASYAPTQYVILLALRDEGFSMEDDIMAKGLQALNRLLWEDESGLRLQVCPSPCWDTALMVIGICDAGQHKDHPKLKAATSWITSHQCLDGNADWRVLQPELTVGGFGWSPWAPKIPDIDDTVTSVMALLKQDPKSILFPSTKMAIQWFMGMQNKDGGFPGFESSNKPSFINALEFDGKAMFDFSFEDITGHALELFGQIMTSPYLREFDQKLLEDISIASIRAVDYLALTQNKFNGGWYGRWGVNYIYGTSAVLCGLEEFIYSSDMLLLGESDKPGKKSKSKKIFHINKPEIIKKARSLIPPALAFLRRSQNADGGWGESQDTYYHPEAAGIGASTASQTSWALMGLLAHVNPEDACISKGIKYLLQTQIIMEEGKSWIEKYHTGTGFPGSYDLNYYYYRHYFPMMALGRFLKAIE